MSDVSEAAPSWWCSGIEWQRQEVVMVFGKARCFHLCYRGKTVVFLNETRYVLNILGMRCI